MGSGFDWLWDLFREKTPEAITTKGLSAGFLALPCITQNCGKTRDYIDLYGDCLSILNDWEKKVTGSAAALNAITHDGGEAVVSECASFCEKGIKSACCNGKKQ